MSPTEKPASKTEAMDKPKLVFIAHGGGDPSVGMAHADAKITIEDNFIIDKELIERWREIIADAYEITLNKYGNEGVWTEEEYKKLCEEEEKAFEGVSNAPEKPTGREDAESIYLPYYQDRRDLRSILRTFALGDRETLEIHRVEAAYLADLIDKDLISFGKPRALASGKKEKVV